MNIEIFLNDNIIKPIDSNLIDYKKEVENKKNILSNVKIDFSSINKLKGNKEILEKSFQNQKAEELDL
jgi:hypothetical protein